MLSCVTENNGCDGSDINPVYKYMENEGLVTNDCFPYTSGPKGRNP